MPVDNRAASPDRAPRAPWTALVVLLLLAGVVTFLVATLGGSEPDVPPSLEGGTSSAPGVAASESSLVGDARTSAPRPLPGARAGLRAEGAVVALDIEAAPSAAHDAVDALHVLLASPVVVFLGDGRAEISFSLALVPGRDGAENVQMESDGRLAARALGRAQVRTSGERVSIEAIQLPPDRAWFVAARSVDPQGRVLEAASQPVARDGDARTAVVLATPLPGRAGLVARVRRGADVLPECAVTVTEISGLPLGRFRFAGDEPEPALLPSERLLRVRVSDARGLKSAGAPPSQEVTLVFGHTTELLFDLPTVAPFVVRGVTHRGEAVPGDLMLWSLDAHGQLEGSVPVTDALELRGAAGWAGRLPPGRYRGVFVPRTEWSRRVFEADVGEDGAEVELDLGHADGDALVELEVVGADGEPLADHRLTLVRETTLPDDVDWAHARTDPRGVAVLRPLMPGRWQVLDYKRGLARMVDLPAGRSDIKLQLPAGVDVGAERLEIRAVAASGEPRPLLNVHVRTPGATWWRLASAGVDAAAVFEGLAPGTYEVRVPPEWSRYADVAEGQATVLVQEGAGTTRLDVRLARP